MCILCLPCEQSMVNVSHLARAENLTLSRGVFPQHKNRLDRGEQHDVGYVHYQYQVVAALGINTLRAEPMLASLTAAVWSLSSSWACCPVGLAVTSTQSVKVSRYAVCQAQGARLTNITRPLLWHLPKKRQRT